MRNASSPHDVDATPEIVELRLRLEEAEEALRALRSGEVDALVVEGATAEPEVYTLKSAVRPYRLLIERMAQGALTVSRDGLILYCNESFAQLLDRPRERLLGTQLLDYIEAGSRTIADNLLAGDDVVGEFEIIDRQGERVEVYVTSAPLQIEGDEMLCLVVTDLSQQELRLRHEAMVEASQDLIYALDRQLIIRTWNRGAEDLTGLPAEEVIGRAEKEVWPTDRRGQFDELVEQVQATGQVASIDTVRHRHDGSLADLSYTLTPLENRAGEVTGYSVVAHDITERKKTEAMLREREARVRLLAQVVDNSPDFIGISDTQGTPLYVNEAGLRLVGADLEQARRTPVSDYFIPEERTFVQDVVLPAVLSGGFWSGELHFRHMVNGSSIPVFYNVFRIDDPETGKPAQFATVTRDLTKQKEAESHRELLLAELNHRVKNTLATIQAIASHTLRNSADMDSFRTSFVGRLQAIANAHDILLSGGDGRASLRKLVSGQVGPYAKVGSNRLNLDGPSIILETSIAHSLALVFHELATNASKYGALKNQDGRIDIGWRNHKSANGELLEIEWHECGGPPVKAPQSKGFGSRLIESALSHSLGGEADIRYESAGLKATLRVPIEAYGE